MNLAEKLIYLRKKQGLTQLELAEKLDISRQAVSRWEVGTAVPSIENLKILSAVYETPVDYFINDGIDGFAKDEDTKGIAGKITAFSRKITSVTITRVSGNVCETEYTIDGKTAYVVINHPTYGYLDGTFTLNWDGTFTVT